MIVLAKPDGPLPPEGQARPPAARHWRNWHRSGVALSGLLHVVVLAALTLSVPVFGRPAPTEDAIPVEVVPHAPEKRPPEAEEPKKTEEEKKTEEKKPEPPQKVEEPKKPEEPKIAAAPDSKAAPEAQKPPPLPAAKPAPEPAAPRPQAARPAPAPPSQPPPALAPAAPPPPPEASLPPVPPPAPEAEQPKGPPAGLKVDADEAPPPPGERKAVGYWVLEPLTVDLRARCGIARITGVLELREQIAEGRYRGVIRTRIAWTRCPAEGAVHAVELRIKGGEVQMIGANGSVDRGAVRGDTMMLEDAYGRSVWKKR